MSMAEPASKQDLQDLAKQIDQKFDKIGERFDKIDERFDAMTEFMRGIETNLLTEFHRYAKGQTSPPSRD